MDVAEKVILITGAGGLLGSSLAKAAWNAGYKLILVDVAETNLTAIVDGLPQSDYLLVVQDACSLSGAKSSIQQGLDKFKKIDCAVHSAYPRSSQFGQKFGDLSESELNWDISKMVGGAILFSQEILRHFVKRQNGCLVHVSSIQGVAPPKFHHYDGTPMTTPIEYSASKAAVIMITKYLSKFYRGNSVRINCVSPGGIENSQPVEFVSRYRADCNNVGLLSASDVAEAILFLCSEKAQQINGENLVIDDGWSL